MAAAARLASIDAVRGLVMVIMLLDHVRDTLGTHWVVGDPMDARLVAPALFFGRTLASLCAPTFIALTGLSAWLYGQTHSRAETSRFPADPRPVPDAAGGDAGRLCLVGAVSAPDALVAGHLGDRRVHDRARRADPSAALGRGGDRGGDRRRAQPARPHHLFARQSVVQALGADPQAQRIRMDGDHHQDDLPVLPWIGVIALGYAIGPWFTRPAEERRRWLTMLGLGLILGFVLLRTVNGYGDAHWAPVPGDGLRSVMSFVALTKYPPSLLFLMPTLGVRRTAARAVRGAERVGFAQAGGDGRRADGLLPAPPVRPARAVSGRGGDLGHQSGAGVRPAFGRGDVAGLSAAARPLYYPTKWFAELKRRRRDLRWLRYF